MHRRIMRMQSTPTTRCSKSPVRLRVKLSRPMPKAWTKKALIAPTAVWNMPAHQQNLDAMVKAGLNGMTMPRRFGGLNFPITPYTMCAEIVAAADAGFGNIWSLQDCIETLYEFGNEDQHSRFIPRICAGETMSMDLTEPDAGSDLQSVMLKATFDEANNCWRLNGVKRFITNGDANLHLVLARSEEGTKDGRGLSMFIYDKTKEV